MEAAAKGLMVMMGMAVVGMAAVGVAVERQMRTHKPAPKSRSVEVLSCHLHTKKRRL